MLLKIFSTNAAGLKFKIESLKNEITNTNAAIFTVQETHFEKKGKLKVDGFEIFETIRKKKDGGTLVGIHKALNPMLIKDYSETFELITVEITVGNKEIRIISGYGPQEYWTEEEKMPFFMALEDEIVKAQLLGKSIIIEMDANSKLGPEWIVNDPHNQTQNGRILAGILERNNLVVVNGMKNKCNGLITRTRVTTEGREASVIDFVIISDDLVESVNSMLIDEDRKHVLVKFLKRKKGTIKKESDHNVLLTSFDIKWNKRVKNDKIEVFNLKNIECQKTFTEVTSESTLLSSCFESEKDLNAATKLFLKRLNSCLHKSFRKIKIKEKVNGELSELFNKKQI